MTCAPFDIALVELMVTVPTFFLHAVPYSLLMYRVGWRANHGALLAVPVTLAVAVGVLQIPCPDGPFETWGSVLLIAGVLLVFAILTYRFFSLIQDGPSGAPAGIALGLAIPYVGAVFAMVWLLLSVRLKELIGVTREDGSENPPTLRGAILIFVSFAMLVFAVAWSLMQDRGG